MDVTIDRLRFIGILKENRQAHYVNWIEQMRDYLALVRATFSEMASQSRLRIQQAETLMTRHMASMDHWVSLQEKAGPDGPRPQMPITYPASLACPDGDANPSDRELSCDGYFDGCCGADDLPEDIVSANTVSIPQARSQRVSRPVLHTSEYDEVIEMYERFEERETVPLTRAEFQLFVKDNWNWKEDFHNNGRMLKMSLASYSK